MTQNKKVIALRLNREALALLTSQQSEIKLELGPMAAIVIGDKPFPVNVERETAPAYQLFERDPVDTQRIHLAGDVTHRAVMKQVLSQEDKLRVRSRTEAAERERTARRVELLDIPDIQSLQKSSASSKRQSASPGTSKVTPRPRQPSPVVRRTTVVPPSASSSPPLLSSSSTLRERLIHLLAIRPCNAQQLSSMLKVTQKELTPVLTKVAAMTGPNWGLRPEVYKDLKIWEWSRYDDKERNMVYQNAKEAYDFLRLHSHAPERANLIRPKSKQKGLVNHATIITTSAASSLFQQQHHTTLSETSSQPPTSRKRPTAAPTDKPRETKRHKSNGKGKERMLSRARKDNEADPFCPTGVPPAEPTTHHASGSDFATVPSFSSAASVSTTNSSTASPSSVAPLGPGSSSTVNHTAVHQSTAPLSDIVSSPLSPAVTSSADTPLAIASENNTTASRDTAASESSDDSFSEDEMPQYIVPQINSQAEFDNLCKEHDNAQRQYIRLRRRINEEYPLFVDVLVNSPSDDLTIDNDDSNDAKERYYQKLRRAYKSRGGDMSQWRGIVRQSRQFNWQLSKVIAIWNELERVYRKSRYRLPTRQNKKNQ